MEEHVVETEELPKADDIDGAFVAVRRDGVSAVELDGEAVLMEDDTGGIHHLDRIATVIWNCLDGSCTLDELAADLAEAFKADLEVVREDVLQLAQTLGRTGLLAGVAAEVHAHSHDGPKGLDEGTAFPAFCLPTVEGRSVSLENYKGRKVLLVNWSARCGYCDKIAGDLAELQPALADHGVDLVLVSYGGAQEHEAKAGQWSLPGPILLQEEPSQIEPFAGQGTPVAYLLDEEGNVAAPIAVGAFNVPALARQVAGQDAAE